MKRKIISLIFSITVFANWSVAQTVITDDSTYTQTSTNAILEVHSSQGNKGILIPRLTTAQRTSMAMTSADDGLVVYDTDTKSFWVWNTTEWVELGDKQDLSLSGTTINITNGQGVDITPAITSTAWSLTGNSISSGQFLGTTNSEDLIFKTNNAEQVRITSSGNVGIGTSSPGAILDVNGTSEFNGTMNLVNNNIESVNSLSFSDPGDQEGISWTGSAAKIFVSPLDGGNSDGYLRLINDGGIVFEAGAEDSESMVITSSNNVGIGTTTPSEKLDVAGNVQFSGALMPSGNAGTSGQILTSQGPGQPPVWQTPASIPLYGNNAASVELSSLVYTTNTTSWEDIPGMTLTYTPEHDYSYVFASLAARLADDNSNAQFGMAMVQVRILVNGVEVAKSATVITDFDDDGSGWYILTSGSVAFSGVRIPVTQGQATTIKLQWKAVVNWASSPWRIEINPTLSDVADHCVLTVFD